MCINTIYVLCWLECDVGCSDAHSVHISLRHVAHRLAHCVDLKFQVSLSTQSFRVFEVRADKK